MTKRRLVWVIVAVCLALAVVLAGALVVRPHPVVNRANFERVNEGMTRAEVEAILGRLPGDDAPAPDAAVCSWMGDGTEILVAFDKNGRVEGCALVEPRGAAFFYRLRAWLGW